MNKHVKRCLIVLGICVSAVTILCCLVMALSPVAKHVVNTHGPSLVGRDMQVGSLLINPFVGSVSIGDFRMAENPDLLASGQADSTFARFESLYVRLSLPALLGRHVLVRRIHLTGFDGVIIHSQDELNFNDIIAHFRSDEPDADTPDDTTGSSWRVSLEDIRIQSSRIRYQDWVLGSRWGLDHINLTVPGLYFGGADRATNAELEFEMERGGLIGISADYDASSNRYEVGLRLDQLNSDIALPFVQEMLAVRTLGASLSGMVRAEGSMNAPADALIRGNLRVDHLNILDLDKNSVLSFDSLKVGLGRLNIATNRFALDTVALYGLRAAYEVDKHGVNTLQRLLLQPDTTAAAFDTLEVRSDVGSADLEMETRPRQPLHWSVRQVLISEADLSYDDRQLSERFRYRLSHIGIKATNLNNVSDNNIQLRAQVGRTGRLEGTYSGGLNFHQDKEDIQLVLQNVDVKEFSPITESLMAYPLTDGELSLHSRFQLDGGIIQSRNRLEIQDMQVGRKKRLSNAPYKSIPLRTGVGLLKSASGLIVMDVPVSGDINSPKFNFRQIIGRAVGKIFFGPLMGVADKKELQEAISLIDDPELQTELEDELQSVDSLNPQP